MKPNPTRPITLIYGCKNEDTQAFAGEINQLANKHPSLKVHYVFSEPPASGVSRPANATTGLVSAELINTRIPSRDAEFFFCGPKAYMADLHHGLIGLGVPEAQLHFEFFGPRQALEAQDAVQAA